MAEHTDRVFISSTWQRFLNGICVAVFASPSVALIPAHPIPGAAGVAAIYASVILRVARSGVVVTTERVIVRNIFSTFSFPMNDVARFELTKPFIQRRGELQGAVLVNGRRRRRVTVLYQSAFGDAAARRVRRLNAELNRRRSMTT